MLYAKHLLGVALLLSVAGCAGEVGQPPGCPVNCGAGMVCDPATGACVPDQTVPPPQQCPYRNGQCGGVCVDLAADPENCGVCGNRCGPNANCIGGACVCATNTANCNNNWFDGCECVGTCNGAQCATPPPAGTTCKADAPGSCPDLPRSYCDGQGSCLPCPQGYTNCDGVWGCECAGLCQGQQCAGGASQCDPALAGSCGGNTSVCSASARECVNCPQSLFNCDGVYGCECENPCNGTACGAAPPKPCDPKNAGACGEAGFFCDAGSCKACPAGKQNCDAIDDCETAGACAPPPVPACTYEGPDACGKDQSKWCYQGQCRDCTAGFFNCDSTRGCECQKGCAGTACAPECTYEGSGECYPNTRWCYQNKCTDCTPGFYNCDGTKGCECQNGCNGTSCAPAPPQCTYDGTGGCSGVTQWCYQDQCTNCSPGFYNCDATRGCECEHGCNGTACAAPPPQCTDTSPGDCGPDTTAWCYLGQCVSCTPGFFNCDGVAGCECQVGCNGTACACAYDQIDPCGGNTSQWCYQGQCTSCTSGFYNCNLTQGCECDTGCDGTACAAAPPQCSASVANDCGSKTQWCYQGQCTSCTAGFYNCDGVNGCECDTPCDGTACGCSASTASDCGSNTQWCYQNKCTSCTAGFYNCDGVNGCECDSGCAGTACAAPPPQCSASVANDCGSNTQWCYQGQCTSCTAGFYNCDGLNGCECDTPCDGTACGCSASTANDCGSVTQWCYQNRCTSCTAGFLNCDGINGCECGTGNKTSWCYQGGCSSCSAGFFNCDGTAGCECSGGCSGSACQ